MMPDDAFDLDAFTDDVNIFLARGGYSSRGVAAATGLSMSALMRFRRLDGGPSLGMAATLARFCNLGLDRYVLR